MPLTTRSLDECRVEDEASFASVDLYPALRDALVRDGYRVRLLPAGSERWDQALLLNLVFWDPRGGGDVMVDDVVPADVVCHMAWHHLAARALAVDGQPLAREALALSEAVASAFDLYLVGRLLDDAPESTFLETQVPALLDAWTATGRSEKAFATLLEEVRRDPGRAFEDLRALLYDAVLELAALTDASAAQAALERLDGHRFGGLLHHYELTTWVLHARTVAAGSEASQVLDAELRRAPDALAALRDRWLPSRDA